MKVFLSLKGLKEYKVDLYLSLVSNLSFVLTYSIFYNVFFSFFDILKWQSLDYLLFFLAVWVGSLSSLTFSLRKFHLTLLTGNFNRCLCLPTNSYLNASLDKTSGKNLFSTILNLIFFVILALFFNFKVSLILFSLFVLFLGLISLIILTNFILSFSFYFKGIYFLYESLFKEIIYLNEKFTPVLFEESVFKNFFYVLPSAFYGYFVIDVLKGNFEKFFFFLPYFIIINVVLIILNYFLWNAGRKSYEAFG